MQKQKATRTTIIENSDNTAEGQLYACPMHPMKSYWKQGGGECLNADGLDQLLIKRLRKPIEWKL
jgi:hypothetical protein